MRISIGIGIGNVCFPAIELLYSVYKFLLVTSIYLQISLFIFSLQSQKVPFCICTTLSDIQPRGRNSFLDDYDACFSLLTFDVYTVSCVLCLLCSFCFSNYPGQSQLVLPEMWISLFFIILSDFLNNISKKNLTIWVILLHRYTYVSEVWTIKLGTKCFIPLNNGHLFLIFLLFCVNRAFCGELCILS